MSTVRHSFEEDGRAVVLLTQAEAEAIRDVLLVSHAASFFKTYANSGGGDVGRAFRVLVRQLAWLESTTTGGGRPKVA